MKKIIKMIVSVMMSILFIGSMTVYAAETETVEVQERSISEQELLDVVYFKVINGETIMSDVPFDENVLTYQSNNVITGAINYYYDGLDSWNRPQYSVVATMVSTNLNIKSSNLMTKAQGVSDWHENDVNHYTGKVAVNTRSYVYTSNPPSNPYCEVKLYVTDSEDYEIYIGYTKLKDAIIR